MQDPDLTALEKIQRWFDTGVRWKTAQKPFIIALVQVWYADDNAIIRQKMFSEELKRFGPIFTSVICQGIQQGELNNPYPDQVFDVIFYLSQGLGDNFAKALMTYELEGDASVRESLLCDLEKTLAAYTDTIERVLGTPTGSLKLMDVESIEAWFDS
jgi:TetR/AcrR family transcriptional repressor of nem operon